MNQDREATKEHKSIDKPARPVDKKQEAPKQPARPAQLPIWKVPPGVLSNAGRLVVLRVNGGFEDDVEAQITTDAQLREVVFGDPLMHAMKVYARRVEVLATKAVTASIFHV